jgi:hypothetical protein
MLSECSYQLPQEFAAWANFLSRKRNRVDRCCEHSPMLCLELNVSAVTPERCWRELSVFASEARPGAPLGSSRIEISRRTKEGPSAPLRKTHLTGAELLPLVQ